MRKQQFYPENGHKFRHTCRPTPIGTSQKQREHILGRTGYVTHDYNTDNRYNVLSGFRGYRERDSNGRHEHYAHNNFEHTQNNFTLRKPVVSPHYYYKPSARADYYKPPVQQHSSEIVLTDVTSYDDGDVSYRGSLVSVASSFKASQDRIQTHKVRQQQHHAHVYPQSDIERMYSRPVYSHHSSDDQKRRHSDMEREFHRKKDEKLHRRHTDEIFSKSRTKNNPKNRSNNNQSLAYSVYNASINSNDNSKNKVPLMLFRKDEEKGSNNSDVVYIPVVVLPDKQENACADGSNTGSERVDNEQPFTKRKYFIQHNVARDTIVENEESTSDTPNLLFNENNIVYRKADNNLFEENNHPLLSNTAGINRIRDRNTFDESLFTVKPIVNDNIKKSNGESTFTNLFPHGTSTEIEKLQEIITCNDCQKVPKNDPLNVMVAKFDKVENPFTNPNENIKPTSSSPCSRNNGTSWRKNIVQHSQSVQVSQTSITRKDGAVQVSNVPKIITKDGEVQATEIPSKTIIKTGEIMYSRLKGEKPGIISEDVVLSTPITKNCTEYKEKEKHNSGKLYSGNKTNDSNNDSKNKYKEIIQEINELVSKISREGYKPKSINQKGGEESNCCQRRVCKRENNDDRQTKNKHSNENKQFATENLPMKKEHKDVPKTKNSSCFQQESYESSFRKLFNNDYKMTSRPPYLKIGMHTDSPMFLENTYNWLTEPNIQFDESTSSNFRTVPKRVKNVQTAFPFFTKLKKKTASKDNITKSDDTVKKEEQIEKEEEKEEVIEETFVVVDLECAEDKTSKLKISKKREEGDKRTEKSKETEQEKQIEVNLSLLWDYIIQGFNLYLGKTVHTVIIDSIYTVGRVTEKLQNRS